MTPDEYVRKLIDTPRLEPIGFGWLTRLLARRRRR
jgi:hypothetical protein